MYLMKVNKMESAIKVYIGRYNVCIQVLENDKVVAKYPFKYDYTLTSLNIINDTIIRCIEYQNTKNIMYILYDENDIHIQNTERHIKLNVEYKLHEKECIKYIKYIKTHMNNTTPNISDKYIYVININNNIDIVLYSDKIYQYSLKCNDINMYENIVNNLIKYMKKFNIYFEQINLINFSSKDISAINQLLTLKMENEKLSIELNELKNKHEKLINQISHIQEHFKEMEINKVSDIKVYMDINTKEFEETLKKINNFNIKMADIKHHHK